jgi:hypothetical protein
MLYGVLLKAAAGCSGINMFKSVAPIDVLPFFMQADPPSAQPDRALLPTVSIKQIAQI